MTPARVPPPSDPDRGIWQGRLVARCATSPEGFIVLIGRADRDNDILTFKLAAQNDVWMHVAGSSGSHVIVRNPDSLDRLPRETVRWAAALAAGYSKARGGGRVAVHVARVRDVSKPRGLPPGKVQIRRFETVRVTPTRLDD